MTDQPDDEATRRAGFAELIGLRDQGSRIVTTGSAGFVGRVSRLLPDCERGLQDPEPGFHEGQFVGRDQLSDGHGLSPGREGEQPEP